MIPLESKTYYIISKSILTIVTNFENNDINYIQRFTQHFKGAMKRVLCYVIFPKINSNLVKFMLLSLKASFRFN